MHGVRAVPRAGLALAGEYAVLAGTPGKAGTRRRLCAAGRRPSPRAAKPGRVACRVTVAQRGQWHVPGRWFAARVAARAGSAAPRAVAAVAPRTLGVGAACAV